METKEKLIEWYISCNKRRKMKKYFYCISSVFFIVFFFGSIPVLDVIIYIGVALSFIVYFILERYIPLKCPFCNNVIRDTLWDNKFIDNLKICYHCGNKLKEP